MPQLKLKNRDENRRRNKCPRERHKARGSDQPYLRCTARVRLGRIRSTWRSGGARRASQTRSDTPEGRGSLALHTQAVLQGADIMAKTQGGAAVAAREHR